MQALDDAVPANRKRRKSVPLRISLLQRRATERFFPQVVDQARERARHLRRCSKADAEDEIKKMGCWDSLKERPWKPNRCLPALLRISSQTLGGVCLSMDTTAAVESARKRGLPFVGRRVNLTIRESLPPRNETEMVELLSYVLFCLKARGYTVDEGRTSDFAEGRISCWQSVDRFRTRFVEEGQNQARTMSEDTTGARMRDLCGRMHVWELLGSPWAPEDCLSCVLDLPDFLGISFSVGTAAAVSLAEQRKRPFSEREVTLHISGVSLGVEAEAFELLVYIMYCMTLAGFALSQDVSAWGRGLLTFRRCKSD